MKRLGLVLLVGVIALGMAGCPQRVITNVRLVNAVPDNDAPTMDACFNGDKEIEGIAYPDSSNYTALLPDTYDIRVVTAGNDCAQPALVQTQQSMAGGSEFTLVVTGRTGNKALSPLWLIDNNDAPEDGSAKIRFVNVAPNAGEVDLSVDGASSPLFQNVDYRENGGYRVIDSGAYDMTIDGEGLLSTDVHITNQIFGSGRVYTIFLIGLDSVTNSTLQTLITLDN